MLVPAKMPALNLTVAHGKFMVSKIREIDLAVIHPWCTRHLIVNLVMTKGS